MSQATSCSTPYLFRRGGVWWWRRRLPLPVRTHAALRPGLVGLPSEGRVVRPTLAFSLRTACRNEARRRGARLAVRFDDAVAMGRARMDGAPEIQASFARDLLALLRDQVAQQAAQMAAQQAASRDALARQTEFSRALVNRIGAPPARPWPPTRPHVQRRAQRRPPLRPPARSTIPRSRRR